MYLSPSPDGYVEGATDLGQLKATMASFDCDLPDGVDLASVGSVVMWCEPSAVQFAHAQLAAP